MHQNSTQSQYPTDILARLDPALILQDARDDRLADSEAGRVGLDGEERGIRGDGEECEGRGVGLDRGEEESEEIRACLRSVQVGAVAVSSAQTKVRAEPT
jgi:hypothetical protein